MASGFKIKDTMNVYQSPMKNNSRAEREKNLISTFQKSSFGGMVMGGRSRAKNTNVVSTSLTSSMMKPMDLKHHSIVSQGISLICNKVMEMLIENKNGAQSPVKLAGDNSPNIKTSHAVWKAKVFNMHV